MKLWPFGAKDDGAGDFAEPLVVNEDTGLPALLDELQGPTGQDDAAEEAALDCVEEVSEEGGDDVDRKAGRGSVPVHKDRRKPHRQGKPANRRADARAEARDEGHGEVRGLTGGKVEDFQLPKWLTFITYYLSNGRNVAAAAKAMGLSRRTAYRWMQPGHPVKQTIDALAIGPFQAVMRKVAEERDRLEGLLVDNLIESMEEGGPMKPEKAGELIARILGLDKGFNEHELGSETRALLERIGEGLAVAGTKAPAGGEDTAVGEGRVSAE